MDIMSGLAAASQALDIAKKLREFEKSFNEAEFKLQIAELYTALSDVKMALADAKETIQSKDAEIRRLKDIEAAKIKTVRSSGYSFGVEDGKVFRMPFCPTCEQRGQQNMFSETPGGIIYCSVCKRTEDHLPPVPPPPAQ